jgi:hypothetical protein
MITQINRHNINIDDTKNIIMMIQISNNSVMIIHVSK